MTSTPEDDDGRDDQGGGEDGAETAAEAPPGPGSAPAHPCSSAGGTKYQPAAHGFAMITRLDDHPGKRPAPARSGGHSPRAVLVRRKRVSGRARGGGRRFGAERRLVKKWGRESEHGSRTQQE